MSGREAWIGPELSYTMLMRVAEVFAERDGRVYAVNCSWLSCGRVSGREREHLCGEHR